ncbi:MAG: hypothetical protein KDK48_05970 [Chlamydiia bacterium]|nr:hypothetical protein [Chlamydiia bacterium]
MAEEIEKIGKVQSATEKSKVDEVSSRFTSPNQPVEGKFDAMMDQQEGKTLGIENDMAKPTVEDIARDLKPGGIAHSAQDLVAQSQEAVSKIEAIKGELQTPDLEIKKPVAKLMRNKLEHIDDNLRVALSKAGAEVDPTQAAASSGLINPAGNFLDRLTHAQYQLENLGKYLEALTNADKELSPANLLAIQVKVNHVQQELEFFTNMLNKSLESTKALMNVQV